MAPTNEEKIAALEAQVEQLQQRFDLLVAYLGTVLPRGTHIYDEDIEKTFDTLLNPDNPAELARLTIKHSNGSGLIKKPKPEGDKR